MNVDLERLIASPPRLHADGQALWGLHPDVLRILDQLAQPGAATLETGAGLSTLVFAINGSRHTCVVPDAGEVERIKAWCASESVPDSDLSFHTDRSERVLPGLEPEPLDLVLIDGGHAFPSPFIDWYYAGRRLSAGGHLVVDDTQLWTGRVLRDFLDAEPGWELVREVPLRSAVFRRGHSEGELQEWTDQPYVADRSRSEGAGYAVRRALELARRGDWTGMRAALGRRLERK